MIVLWPQLRPISPRSLTKVGQQVPMRHPKARE